MNDGQDRGMPVVISIGNRSYTKRSAESLYHFQERIMVDLREIVARKIDSHRSVEIQRKE